MLRRIHATTVVRQPTEVFVLFVELFDLLAVGAIVA